ncbi:hypothetical protein [Streptomyces zagrosensis]|uniref:Uncharacterized protein n=1 Tax=Streptomyces zagrosensis TaxID=1042984 RepID=A0A7W9QFI2_9ACTN|nr:hypothetical protein [Streptomyces zagrosensis]MBB5938262.1 hypothetical protein [Streptomyces zagrosensis]
MTACLSVFTVVRRCASASRRALLVLCVLGGLLMLAAIHAGQAHAGESQPDKRAKHVPAAVPPDDRAVNRSGHGPAQGTHRASHKARNQAAKDVHGTFAAAEHRPAGKTERQVARTSDRQVASQAAKQAAKRPTKGAGRRADRADKRDDGAAHGATGGPRAGRPGQGKGGAGQAQHGAGGHGQDGKDKGDRGHGESQGKGDHGQSKGKGEGEHDKGQGQGQGQGQGDGKGEAPGKGKGDDQGRDHDQGGQAPARPLPVAPGLTGPPFGAPQSPQTSPAPDAPKSPSRQESPSSQESDASQCPGGQSHRPGDCGADESGDRTPSDAAEGAGPAGRHGVAAGPGTHIGPPPAVPFTSATTPTATTPTATTPTATASITIAHASPGSDKPSCDRGLRARHPGDDSGCGPKRPCHHGPCGPLGPVAPVGHSGCGHSGGDQTKRAGDPPGLPAAHLFVPPRTTDGRVRDTDSPLHERPHDVVELPG